MFTRSEVIVLTTVHTHKCTHKQTHTQIPAKTSNVLHYTMTLGKYWK